MLGQDFLVSAITELIPNDESEDSVKKVSRTSLIEVTEFPTIIVEDAGYDYNQEVSSSDVILRKENYNIAIIVKSVNPNELNENKYKAIIDKLDELSDDTISKILEKSHEHEKISNLRLGRGEKFDGTIASIPVMWNMIPVEIILVSN